MTEIHVCGQGSLSEHEIYQESLPGRCLLCNWQALEGSNYCKFHQQDVHPDADCGDVYDLPTPGPACELHDECGYDEARNEQGAVLTCSSNCKSKWDGR